MKILYTVSNPYGMGADRWVYEGYRDAFLAEGHDFYTVSEFDDFEEKTLAVKPDLLMLDFGAFEVYCKRKVILPEFFKKIKSMGTVIFCLITLGVDKDDPPGRIDFFSKYVSFFDVFHSHHPPELTDQFPFKETFGKELYFIPAAANSRYLYPDKPDPKFECDICFVGSYYVLKKEMFKKVLEPLRKKYKVLVYGTGWNPLDILLRITGGFTRELKWERAVKLVNQKRISISQDDERKLYASAKICLNIHEYYPDGTIKGMSNEREFKIPAAGGFQLSDYIPGLERFFVLNKEIAIAKDAEDYLRKIDYYLKNEKERKEIQTAGAKRAIKEHTYRNRVKKIMELYKTLSSKKVSSFKIKTQNNYFEL